MALDEWRLEPAEDAAHALLIAGAGVNLPNLVNDLADAGLAGLEWGAGVPGTIGGAVVSNAGAHGQCVADTLRTARVLFTDPADAADTVPPAVRDLPAADLYLDYRHSRFRAARRVVFDDDGRPVAAPRAPIEPPEMIVGATFLLMRDDPAAIRARVRAYRQHRKDTQPPQPSAGSVFKNPPGDYAGRLIEACGLKGTRLGKAEISPRHANFIVNTGGASAADVVRLIALARARALRRRARACGRAARRLVAEPYGQGVVADRRGRALLHQVAPVVAHVVRFHDAAEGADYLSPKWIAHEALRW